jgi:hypothetical protein
LSPNPGLKPPGGSRSVQDARSGRIGLSGETLVIPVVTLPAAEAKPIRKD